MVLSVFTERGVERNHDVAEDDLHPNRTKSQRVYRISAVATKGPIAKPQVVTACPGQGVFQMRPPVFHVVASWIWIQSALPRRVAAGYTVCRQLWKLDLAARRGEALLGVDGLAPATDGGPGLETRNSVFAERFEARPGGWIAKGAGSRVSLYKELVC